MPYATPADFKALFPEDESVELSNLDDPSAVTANDERIQAALDEAQLEVDSYVGVSTTLPLTTVPLVLKNAVCRIARYRLDAYSPRESVRNDYEDTVKWLEKLVKGQVSLGISNPSGQTASSGSVAYFSGGRVWDSNSLKGYGD